MDEAISGIHHITAIAGAPRPNVDFYCGLLGLRLVKKTVNFDDTGTYHLYYGDELGRPGTILTFFPYPNAVPGRAGKAMAVATAYSIKERSLEFWMERFADEGHSFDLDDRFGQRLLGFDDPDGLRLELIANDDLTAIDGDVSVEDDGPGPREHALRGFHSCTIALADPRQTLRLLTNTFGWTEVGEENGRVRVRAAPAPHGALVDLVRSEERGRGGAGTIHHIAFRARGDEEQLRWRETLLSMGFDVTDVQDRFYFHSIYFREPGGVLFEIATDGPGFTRDEDRALLGTGLKLPPWLQAQRPQIEKRLVELAAPPRARAWRRRA